MKNSQILPFIKNYVEFLSDELGRLHPEYRLTNIQKGWLNFCLTEILLTNSICWRRYERLPEPLKETVLHFMQ